MVLLPSCKCVACQQVSIAAAPAPEPTTNSTNATLDLDTAAEVSANHMLAWPHNLNIVCYCGASPPILGRHIVTVGQAHP